MVRVCLIGLLLIITACTSYSVAMDQEFTSISANPSRRPIVLVITRELREATWTVHEFGSDHVVSKLGEPLIHYSEQTLKTLSSQVQLADAPSSSAEFNVIPKMTRFEMSYTPTSFGTTTYLMALEWRVIDRSGRTVFVDTVLGESHGSNLRREALLTAVFADAFRKSQERLAKAL
jgi:hypothetical protein